MQIPEDEQKIYMEFVTSLVRELGSVSIPPDKVLWHYTNGTALIAIIESMSIYSTHISCLNDTTEVRYGSKLFRESLATLRATKSAESIESKLLEGAVEYFKEDPDFPAQARVPHFVSCFSEETDDLSQWRAYGGGENGYAIGFRARDLWGCPNAALVRVDYDAEVHRRLAAKAAEAMVQFFLDAVRKFNPNDLLSFGEEFLKAWDSVIVMLAPLIKDPGFSKERECRILKGFTVDEFNLLKFVQKNSLMSRHFPLQPPSGNAFTPYRLPIAEVMVGPCRHPQLGRTNVDTLLRHKGYPTGLVSLTKIPFQST